MSSKKIIGFFLWIIFLLSLVATADNGTNETYHYSAFNQGILPLVVSDDDRWVYYVDGYNFLHQIDLKNPSAREKRFYLNNESPCLKETQNGVVLLSEKKEVDFSLKIPQARKVGNGNQLVDSGSWQTTESSAIRATQCMATLTSLENENPILVEAHHLSAYGYDREPIKITNYKSGEIDKSIPTSRLVFHVKLIDQNKKLLVAEATLGEGDESNSRPSYVTIYVYDLLSAKIDYVKKFSAYFGDSESWLLSYVENSRELYHLEKARSNSQHSSVYVKSVNFTECGEKSILLKGKIDSVVAFLVDPKLRWIATAEGEYEESKFKLKVYSLKSGEQLFEQVVEHKLRSLAANSMGDEIYSVEEPTLISGDVEHGSAQYLGGGNFLRFNIGEQTKQLEPTTKLESEHSFCPMENETSSAREIQYVSNMPEEIKTISFNSNAEGSEINFTGNLEGHGVWGVSQEGEIWVYREKKLFQLNPLTGAIVKKIQLTFDGEEGFVRVDFFRKRIFETSAGKIFEIPFEDYLIRDFSRPETAKKIFIEKKQRSIGAIDIFHKNLHVQWSEYTGKNQNQKTPGWINAYYDIQSGKPFLEEDASQLYVLDEPIPDYEVYTDVTSAMKPGDYGWAFYEKGILLAYYYSPEKNTIQKIFLDGLDYSSSNKLRDAQRLIDLDFGKAAVITQEGLVLLDAVTRKHYPLIPLKNTLYAQWSQSQNLLIVETGGFEEKGKMVEPRLHVYHVD